MAACTSRCLTALGAPAPLAQARHSSALAAPERIMMNADPLWRPVCRTMHGATPCARSVPTNANWSGGNTSGARFELVHENCGTNRTGSARPGSSGAWEVNEGYQYYIDRPLVHALVRSLRGSSILEFGAGKGCCELRVRSALF